MRKEGIKEWKFFLRSSLDWTSGLLMRFNLIPFTYCIAQQTRKQEGTEVDF